MAKIARKVKQKISAKKATKTYDASNITWLKGLKGVRAKPQPYLGRSADTTGLRQCGLEILGNCLDETTNGHGDTIGVKIIGDTFTFFDNGRGIPTGPHPEHKGVDTLTILATEMHAGGKLDAKDGNYEYSLGTHGMGLSVVNALSSSLHIWSIRGGKVKKQSFKEGVPISKVIEVKMTDVPKIDGKPWKVKSGTVVEFTWDKTIFDKGTKLDVVNFVQTVRDMSWFAAYQNKNKRQVTKFIVDTGKKKALLIERKSLFNYVTNHLAQLNEGQKEDDKFGLIEGTKLEFFGPQFDFVGSWSTYSNERLHGAVNSLHNSGGGKHVQGTKAAIFNAIKSLAKKGQNFREQDLFAGFIGCVNVRIPSPKFDGQGKNALMSQEGFLITQGQLYSLVLKWAKKNKELVAKLIERACAIYDVTNDLSLQKKLAAALATKKNGKSMLPDQLIQSTTRDPMQRELFTLEGKSASGTGKKASERSYQEVLPLRGKLLNVAKAGKDKMKDSQVIIDLLRAIGYDAKNPTGPIRVGKIMVLSDPDPDGPLSADTLVPYIDNATGQQRVDTIEYLYQLSQAVARPIKVLAMSPQGIIQQANSVDIGIRESTNQEYRITMSNGAVLKCTPSHKWRVLQVAKPKKLVTSTVTGMTYLAAPNLMVGDQIQAQNRDGFLTVAAIELATVPFTSYYCMTVPLFENFLVQTTGTDGTITNIVSSNCHINSLILTLLWKTMPHLFSEGRIFRVNAPLFTYSTPHRKYYGSNLRHLMQQVGSKLDLTRVSRTKGFGEMNPDTLKEIAFDPETRSLTRVDYPMTTEQKLRIDKIMGGDTSYRREMIGV